MRKMGAFVAALFSVAASIATATPSQADEMLTLKTADGRCLRAGSSVDEKYPRLGYCGDLGARWESISAHDTLISVMLKHAVNGKCMDHNAAGDVYLSSCSANDPGQLWQASPSCPFVYINATHTLTGTPGSYFLTAWDGGAVSLTDNTGSIKLRWTGWRSC